MFRVLLPATLAVLLIASAAIGDVIVTAPGVRVQVGKGPPPRPVLPRPVIVPGDPPPVPIDPLPSDLVRARTIDEFARAFRPVSGPAKYEVVLEHPCTGAPVKICFSLPGCPRRVVVNKNQLVFRYGLCKTVSLNFNRNGTVGIRD